MSLSRAAVAGDDPVTTGDEALRDAALLVQRVKAGVAGRTEVAAVFHQPTGTVSYVAYDPGSHAAAVIDSVLDFDAASGRTGTEPQTELSASCETMI